MNTQLLDASAELYLAQLNLSFNSSSSFISHISHHPEHIAQ